jgi:N-sulfoglucosamine sulfohydrolase
VPFQPWLAVMIKRNIFAGICALLGALFPLVAHAAAEAPETKPNVLFILSDDQSVPHLGCYGNKAIRTPNLDRFAAEGMCFDKQFCGSPQCVPSRATFMTGRSAVAVRITRFSSPLPADVPALPDLLRASGYYTGICRRGYHLDGGTRPTNVSAAVYERHPELRTFDKRVDFLDQNSPPSETVPVVNRFLDKVPAGKPFFLWVSFNDPHHPWDRNAISKPHDPATIQVPPYLPDIPEIRNALARYYDEVSRMDAEFQSVMDILDKRGLTTNTLVLFLGDNGYAFPRGKGSLHDPGLNTPLLVRWPGKVKPGSRSSELISGEDITPTVLEAASVTPLKEMSGKSFLKLLLGEPFTARKFVFAERGPHGNAPFTEKTRSNSFDLSRCVRSKQYKLIYNCTPQLAYAPIDSAGENYWKRMESLHQEGKLAPEFERAYFTSPRPVFELYDLEKDPAELHNIAGQPELRDVEFELKSALHEKMMLDYDFLPLPTGGGRGKKAAASPEATDEE